MFDITLEIILLLFLFDFDFDTSIKLFIRKLNCSLYALGKLSLMGLELYCALAKLESIELGLFLSKVRKLITTFSSYEEFFFEKESSIPVISTTGFQA